jgi:hypothetical protein
MELIKINDFLKNRAKRYVDKRIERLKKIRDEAAATISKASRIKLEAELELVELVGKSTYHKNSTKSVLDSYSELGLEHDRTNIEL